ncbi:hypothetical protein ACSX1A_04375 [Pontibacter sp. MBLB2868]|uniref:hypothetical protein n=1 Tax=Pontibacter sp. MBLB2868 TaxID=3451555 RepID=UPI003F74E728
MNKLKTKYNALAQCKLDSLSLSTALLAIYSTLAELEIMKEKILEACIIGNVVTLIYLFTISASFSNFIDTSIYLALIALIPMTLGILVWLKLSEKMAAVFQLKNNLKFIIYLILNSAIPLLILLLQSYIDWGGRLTNEILRTNYFENYFFEFGFIIIGVLPTLLKLSLDFYKKGELTSKII